MWMSVKFSVFLFKLALKAELQFLCEGAEGSFLPLCSLKFLQLLNIVENGSPHHLSRKLLPARNLTNDCIVGQACRKDLALFSSVCFMTFNQRWLWLLDCKKRVIIIVAYIWPFDFLYSRKSCCRFNVLLFSDLFKLWMIKDGRNR